MAHAQIVSIVMAGAAIGSLLGGPLADAWGRRRSIILSAILFIAGAAAMAAAPVFSVLLLGRFCVGTAVGASGMVVSVYLSELASPYWRGMIVATNELAVCAGCLLALGLSVVAHDAGFHWRALLGISSLPAVVQLLGSPWLPQSPVWRVRQVLSALPVQAIAALLPSPHAGGPQHALPSSAMKAPLKGQQSNSDEASTLPGLHDAPSLDWSHLGAAQRQHLDKAHATLASLRGSQAAANAEMLRIVKAFLAQHESTSVHARVGSSSSSGSEGSQGPHSSSRGLLASQDKKPPMTTTPSPSTTPSAVTVVGFDAGEGYGGSGGVAVRAEPPGACAASLGQLQLACSQRGSRHALGLAISSAIVQNMAFSNALLYYAKSIFDAAGLENHLLPSLGVGTAKLLGVAVAIPLLPKMPRRLLLTVGMLGQILSCVAMALAFALCSDGSPVLQNIVLVGMLVFIFAWDISWAPGLWVVCSELLPSQVRGTGMGLAVAAFWASSATSNQVVLTIADSAGWAGFMAVVAALTLFALGFVRTALPETQGRPLAAIQASITSRARSLTDAHVVCPLLLWPMAFCTGCTAQGKHATYTPVG